MKITCLFTAALLVAGLGLHAQEKPDKEARKEEKATFKAQKERYTVLEIGGAYGHTLDARMAENGYKGAGVLLNIGSYVRSPRGLFMADLLSSRFLLLTPKHGESMTLNSFNESQATWLRNVRTLGTWTLRAGGGASLLGNVRFNSSLGNSSFNSDIAVSAVAAGNLEREIRLPLLGACRIDYTLRLPLLSYLNRIPDYGLSGLGGFGSYVAPIGVFTRVSSRIGISRPLKAGNPNRWQLSYAWDFYAFNDNEIHPLRVANHSLTYSLYINTGKIASKP